MTWVELTGPVGAGKSALAPAVIEAVRASGWDTPGVGQPGSVGGASVRRWQRLRAGLAYGLAHPGLAAIATRALLDAPLTWRHRRAIGTLVVRLAATTQIAHLRATDICLVVDEGWVHRAVNLFGWTPGPDLVGIDAYLERIPYPDVLIVVDAVSSVRAERLQQRGLPKRLHGKDPAVVEGFLQRSARIVEHAADHLERQGVRVVRISNVGSLEASEQSVAEQVPVALRALPGSSATTPIVSIRAPFPVPRPGRASLVQGRRRGIATSQDEGLMADVLAEYGLRGRPTRLLDQSGRSLSILVETPTGGAVLKRYKQSLGTTSIRCQHSILLELERLGFPCPRLRRTQDGSTLVERGGHHYDLTVFMEGYVRWDRSLLPPRESRQLRQSSGAALASFHKVLREFEPEFAHHARVAPSDEDGPDPLIAAVSDCLATRVPTDAPTRWRDLWRRGEQIRETLVNLGERLEAGDLPLTVIHGDYGPYNLLVRHERRLAVMDLELSRRDWRLIDLARAIPRFGTDRRGLSLTRARRFLVGYLRQQPVSRGELQLLPTLSAYLDLRRSVVSWERYASSGDTDWLTAAAGHLGNSDRAQNDGHALALVTQMITRKEQ